MKSAVLTLVALAACDPMPDQPAWPPPPGTPFVQCGTLDPGGACSVEGWCSACDTPDGMLGCYCDGERVICFRADSVCDFGEGAGCAIEGNPNCGIAPAPGYQTCTGGQVEISYVCPFAECPDYDPGTSACTCADGTCP